VYRPRLRIGGPTFGYPTNHAEARSKQVRKAAAALAPAQRARIGPMTARERAAYHEAGHAVVGLQCGARLRFVQVDEGAAGQCIFERSTLTGDRAIRTAMAGPAAEYMHAHPEADSFTLADCNASTGDLCDVDDYCASFPPEEGQRMREQHWAVARGILMSRWGDVQALARFPTRGACAAMWSPPCSTGIQGIPRSDVSSGQMTHYPEVIPVLSRQRTLGGVTGN
jgi:hypothetical protein